MINKVIPLIKTCIHRNRQDATYELILRGNCLWTHVILIELKHQRICVLLDLLMNWNLY